MVGYLEAKPKAIPLPLRDILPKCEDAYTANQITSRFNDAYRLFLGVDENGLGYYAKMLVNNTIEVGRYEDQYNPSIACGPYQVDMTNYTCNCIYFAGRIISYANGLSSIINGHGYCKHILACMYWLLYINYEVDTTNGIIKWGEIK